MAKKTIIHVNQHNIRRNLKTGSQDPVLTTKTYNTNQYGKCVVLRDKSGKELGRFVYSPDKPLSCGARVWFETKELDVEILN
jgi:hypothetical protein